MVFSSMKKGLIHRLIIELFQVVLIFPPSFKARGSLSHSASSLYSIGIGHISIYDLINSRQPYNRLF